MTERDAMTPGRADLSALDRSVDFTKVADRVVSPALARFIAMRRGGFAATLRAYTVPMLAAAMVVMAIGLGVFVRVTNTPRAGDPTALLAQWIQAEHVPTNGELLLTFQGYGR
jgi:hypothetical protein